MKPLVLTWADFDFAVERLAARAAEVGAKAIYGVPRGGLPLAVAISHATGLEFATLILDDKTLVVDDIADTGKTLAEYNLPSRFMATWVCRDTCSEECFAVITELSSRWVVFPWEAKERAEADEKAYKRRSAAPSEPA